MGLMVSSDMMEALLDFKTILKQGKILGFIRWITSASIEERDNTDEGYYDPTHLLLLRKVFYLVGVENVSEA